MNLKRALNFMGFFLVIYFGAILKISAQSLLNIPESNMVTVTDSGKQIHAHLLISTNESIPKPYIFYHWFKSGKIMRTEGGYSGVLLDGLFQEFYANKNLCEEGNYYYGLKSGLWKEWNPNGTLSILTNFIKGKKYGNYARFDSIGLLKEKGKFRNNKLDGKQIKYVTNGNKEIYYYKKGVLVNRKSSNFIKLTFDTISQFFASLFKKRKLK